MAQVTIGPDFFAKAKNDYSEWKWALLREFMQNSIDCGSRSIAIDISYERGITSLSVTNNGNPMSKEILVDKLLSLGSSGKDFAGTVGGFGKAKEILYFCWKSYHIESGDWSAEGAGGNYELKKLRRHRPGTLSRIQIEGSFAEELEEQARFFLSVCNVRCTFTVNGKPVESSLRSGHYRRDLRCGKIYTNRQLNNRLVVRIGGIPMFTSWISFAGCVVLELSGTSADVLTANRDHLRYEHRTEVEGFVSALSTDRRKALKQPTTEIIRFQGSKIQCKMPSLSRKFPVEPRTEATRFISTAALRSGEFLGVEEENTSISRRVNALATSFVIKNEIGRKLPYWWRPDNERFTKHARILADVWARILVTIHSALEIEDEFSIGFVFAEDTIAQHEWSQQHGRTYLLNPCKCAGRNPWLCRWKYSRQQDLDQLVSVALHEVVHGLGYNDHDESYAAKLTEMTGRLLSHVTQLRKAYRRRAGEVE